MERTHRLTTGLVARLGTASLIASSLALFALAQAQAATSTEVEAKMQAVEAGLLPAVLIEGETPEQAMMKLSERMAFYHVPGVSIAVIDNGTIEWAKGYGVLEAGSKQQVTPETLFQAASISKAVTATAVLELVQNGTLNLDDEVNDHLRSWRVPDTPFTQEQKVTLRGLLGHTAGLTVDGFEGYAAGQAVPTQLQVLDGVAPANSAPVRVNATPGSQFSYSGGGYTVLQVLLEDVTGKPFPELLQEQVLEPLGMTNSTFAQPLPQTLAAKAASGHLPDGTPIAGKRNTYPELAAAGLWTTPSDLARWLIALQHSVAGEKDAPLSQAMMAQMLTDPLDARYGLGLEVGGSDASRWFGHNGANVGFLSTAIAFTGTGQGVVVMTNADTGSPLFQEIVRGVAYAYDWPDRQPVVKAVVEVDPTVYGTYVGQYEGVAPVAITQQEQQLFLVLPPMFGGEVALYPASETEFFALNGMEVAFQTGANGKVDSLTISSPELNDTPPFVRQP